VCKTGLHFYIVNHSQIATIGTIFKVIIVKANKLAIHVSLWLDDGVKQFYTVNACCFLSYGKQSYYKLYEWPEQNAVNFKSDEFLNKQEDGLKSNRITSFISSSFSGEMGIHIFLPKAEDPNSVPS